MKKRADQQTSDLIPSLAPLTEKALNYALLELASFGAPVVEPSSPNLHQLSQMLRATGIPPKIGLSIQFGQHPGSSILDPALISHPEFEAVAWGLVRTGMVVARLATEYMASHPDE